ncbi:MAG: BMP family ABC transporter substrate-binding protein, partial [Thermoleophilaceae bacterium]
QGVVEEAAAGEFESGTYVGTLENEGVGLAPFHEFEDDVPPELAQEVEEVTQQIIDGEIEVRSEATPSGA